MPLTLRLKRTVLSAEQPNFVSDCQSLTSFIIRPTQGGTVTTVTTLPHQGYVSLALAFNQQRTEQREELLANIIRGATRV